MQLEKIKLSDLTLDPVNARKHPEKNLEALKGSFKKFGQHKNVVVDKDNVVVAGNGAVMVARDLGWDFIYAYRSPLSGPDLTAYGLADNRTGDLSEWDDDALGKLLQSLHEDDYPIAEIGFDPGDYDFDAGVGGSGNTEDDEIPEVEENIHGVKRGDIWQLGEHRIMCGDSTSKDDVDRLMQGEKADMVFTDPPYGMNLDTDYSGMKGWHQGKSYKRVENDDKPYDPSHLVGLADEMFLWGADYYASRLPHENGAWLVWDKRVDESKDAMFGSGFELCWSNKKHKRKIYRKMWAGFMGDAEASKRLHPTQKPTELVTMIIDDCAPSSKHIIDLFIGSGSTLIACEKTGRKCYGMEIDPHYCSVIIERWQNYTGQTAKKTEANG